MSICFQCPFVTLLLSDPSEKRPRCGSCRLAKCLLIGMRYCRVEDKASTPRIDMGYGRYKELTLCSTVSRLLQLDSTRCLDFGKMRISEDPTMDDLINCSLRLTPEEPKRIVASGTPQVLTELAFLGIWASVEFHNRLDFMESLAATDKKILIKHFAIKSFLLSAAFRCFSQKIDRLVNLDGSELFPPCVRKFVVIREPISY